MRRQPIAVLSALCLAAGAAYAIPPHVRVVNPAAPPGGNGLAWGTAYQNLQQAIDEAVAIPGEVSEIWLAQGTYTPSRETSPGDPATRTFLIPDGVGIYGGFEGVEIELALRDPGGNPTILSGAALTPRPYHIVTAQGAGPSTLVDGVEITGGQTAAIGPSSGGAGVRILGASPTFRRCTIRGNTGISGAGALVSGGAPIFENCTFQGNTVSSAGAGGAGVLIFSGQASFESCTFSGNIAQGPTAGGAVAILSGSATLTACRILANHCETGGALYSGAGSATLINSLISGNTNGISGQNLSLVNCTVLDNPPSKFAAWSGVQGSGTMHNCIVWNNVGEYMSGITPQVGPQMQVSYSIVEPNSMGHEIAGPGVLRADPLLDAAYCPRPYSPAIDAADSGAIPAAIQLDLHGKPRFHDDTGLPNYGAGEPPHMDIGAVECHANTCYPNCDTSTAPPTLNVNDFSCFVSRFASGDRLANCDQSTAAPSLNVLDFTCFVQKFAAGCP